MAFLQPNATRIEHGLIIRERIIPDSAKASRNVASYVPAGAPMKPCKKLVGGVQGLTIHNTADIEEAAGTNDAEQYSRATWPNQAMGGVMVHYYVDEVEAWQNLRDDEQGWHAADGNGPGNTTTISIEIIMDGSGSVEDVGAEKNGALLAALLLKKYNLGVEKMYTHSHWYSKKYCPYYILPHWDKFVSTVKTFLAELNGSETEKPSQTIPVGIEVGKIVTIGKGAVYGGLNDSRGKAVPDKHLAPEKHTVDKVSIHNGQMEARLKEIFSWVPVKYLSEVQAVTPPTEPTEDTSKYTMICGRSVATPAQMRAYLRKKNPAAPDYADLYFQEGAAEDIRGDVAFAQSCVETNHFKYGGDVKEDQNNFCGHGATGGGEPGSVFATPQLGIRVQIQHLKGYSSAAELVNECVDTRFRYLEDRRGCAPYVEWLGIPDNPQGKGWAAGSGYGASILKVLKEIISVEVPAGETVSKEKFDELNERYEELWKRHENTLAVLTDTARIARNLAATLENADKV